MCSLELALVTKIGGGRSKVSFLCIRRDFETIQRGIFSKLAPLLRKHLTDPKCSTIELCFLLHAGLVVGGLLQGRVCPWWPLGERKGREGAQKAVCTWIWGNEPGV
jgi:hypothetical protein